MLKKLLKEKPEPQDDEDQFEEDLRERVRMIETEFDDQLNMAAASAAVKAIDGCLEQYEVAREVVKAVSKVKRGHWHCVVGRRFGSNVSHESGSYAHFYIGYNAVLVFKSAG